MKKYVLLILTVSFFSCKSKSLFLEKGTSFFLSKHKTEELILRSDSTFTYTRYIVLPAPSCSGKLLTVKKNTLILECVDGEKEMVPLMRVSKEYLRPRTRELKIISKDKIKIWTGNGGRNNYVTLRRVKLNKEENYKK